MGSAYSDCQREVSLHAVLVGTMRAYCNTSNAMKPKSVLLLVQVHNVVGGQPREEKDEVLERKVMS